MDAISSRPQPPERPAWRIPAFLAGSILLTAVVLAKPSLRIDPIARANRQLIELQSLLDKPRPDADAVAALTDRLRYQPPPGDAAEPFNLMLGTAYLQIAEAWPYDPRVVDWNRAAWRILNQVADDKIPEGDRMKRAFRFTKALAREPKSQPPKPLLDSLALMIDCGDEPSEGSRLMGELARRLDPPDYKAAKASFRDFFAQVGPYADQRLVAEARLAQSEVLFALNEFEEARKGLDKLGASATPNTRAEAGLLNAKCLARTGRADEAIRAIELLVQSESFPPKLSDQATRLLADTLAGQGKFARAAEVLLPLGVGFGADARMARLRRGVWLLSTRPAEGLAILSKELADDPEDIPSSLSADLEQAANAALARGDDAMAVSLARLRASLDDEPGQSIVLASTLTVVGQRARDRAAKLPPADQEAAFEAARLLFEEAAKLTGMPTPAMTTPAELAQRAKQTMTAYLKAGNRKAALAEAVTALKIEGISPTDARDLGIMQAETLFADKKPQEALKALERLGELDGPALARARLVRANVGLGTDDPKDHDAAVELLEANLAPGAADDSTREKSVYRLAYFAYQKGDFETATRRFEQALRQYPIGSTAEDARYRLGLCGWYQGSVAGRELAALDDKIADPGATPEDKARLTAQRGVQFPIYIGHLKKGLAAFDAVEKELAARAKHEKLSTTEAALLQQAGFKAAACAFALGDYEECLTRYEALAHRYEGKIEQLVALSQVWQCYAVYLKKPQEARFALAKIREAFNRLEDAEFDGAAQERSRDFWESWLKETGLAK